MQTCIYYFHMTENITELVEIKFWTVFWHKCEWFQKTCFSMCHVTCPPTVLECPLPSPGLRQSARGSYGAEITKWCSPISITYPPSIHACFLIHQCLSYFPWEWPKWRSELHHKPITKIIWNILDRYQPALPQLVTWGDGSLRRCLRPRKMKLWISARNWVDRFSLTEVMYESSTLWCLIGFCGVARGCCHWIII